VTKPATNSAELYLEQGHNPLTAVTTIRSLPQRTPVEGELVQVRSRRWLVEEVVRGSR